MQRVAAVALASLIAGVAGGTGLAAAQPPQSAPMGEPPVSLMEASPVLKAIDANHDHIISAAELANAPAALLTLDKNGDGKLTPDEYRPPRPEGGDKEGSKHRPPPPQDEDK